MKSKFVLQANWCQNEYMKYKIIFCNESSVIRDDIKLNLFWACKTLGGKMSNSVFQNRKEHASPFLCIQQTSNSVFRIRNLLNKLWSIISLGSYRFNIKSLWFINHVYKQQFDSIRHYVNPVLLSQVTSSFIFMWKRLIVYIRASPLE